MTSSEVPIASGIEKPRASTRAGTMTNPPPTPKNPVRKPTTVPATATLATVADGAHTMSHDRWVVGRLSYGHCLAGRVSYGRSGRGSVPAAGHPPARPGGALWGWRPTCARRRSP